MRVLFPHIPAGCLTRAVKRSGPSRLAVFLPPALPLMRVAHPVLIVDDEPAVRDLMARWAASLGMHPTTAGNADEALETLRGTDPELAVIDVVMPGKNGLWLANQLRRDHPHTALVLATAHTDLLVTSHDSLIAD